MSRDKEMPERSPALDRAFPAVWLLGAAGFMVIALMLLCGWRIFLLEGEAREVARERLLLERDRDEFMTYGGDLPQLVERHKALELETRQFESRRDELRSEVASLEERRESLNFETRDLMGALTELRAQSEALGAEVAKTRAELVRLRPEGEETKRQIGILQAQEKVLNEGIAQKQKREAALTASVEGLERQRAHAQQLLARIAEDRQTYADFEKIVNERMGQLDGVVARLAELNGNYGERLDEMVKVRTGMMHGLETLNVDLQGIAGYLDTVKKDRSAWAAALSETSGQNRELREQIAALADSAKRFVSILDNAENAGKTFQATLLTEAAIINRLASEDARARSQLEETAREFADGQDALKKLVAQIRDDGNQIRTLLTSQHGELASVAEAARGLAAQLEKGRQGMDASVQAGVTLSHTAVTLSDQVEEVRGRLKQVDVHNSRMEEMLAGQADRLKNLATLARELSTEINESRRQGMRFQDIISALHASLEEIRHNSGAAGSGGDGASSNGDGANPAQGQTPSANE